MLRYCMTSSYWRRSFCRSSQSAKGSLRTVYLPHTTIYYRELESTRIMTADMRECCSRLVVCAVLEHFTRSSRKSCLKWESKSSSMPRITRTTMSSIASLRIRGLVASRQGSKHPLKMRTLNQGAGVGATQRAPPGILGMIPSRNLEHVVAHSLLQPRAEQTRTLDQDFRRLRSEDHLQHKDLLVATGTRSILSTMLEPG